MKSLITKIAMELIREKIEREIQSILKNWGIQTCVVEIEKYPAIFLTFPYKNAKSDLTEAMTRDAINDLYNNGFRVNLITGHKTKGIRMYVIVKKEII